MSNWSEFVFCLMLCYIGQTVIIRCVLSRCQTHHRDLSTVTLGVLGVGVIGKRSKSFSVGMLALELDIEFSGFSVPFMQL